MLLACVGNKKPHEAAMSQRPPPPCRFYQIGQCSAGASCKFAHVKDAIVKSDTVCKFWQKQLQHGEHLVKHCKRWASTWQKDTGWAPEAG